MSVLDSHIYLMPSLGLSTYTRPRPLGSRGRIDLPYPYRPDAGCVSHGSGGWMEAGARWERVSENCQRAGPWMVRVEDVGLLN